MQKLWWHDAIVYQVYPRSFQDSNGDGIGDLPGITARLSYLQALGINTLWLCPTFASPMVDNGYDISDYYAVNPEFGTLEDLRALIAQAQAHGIRVLLDLVLNHTSDQHAWFQSALESPSSPYRDFYIFRDGVDGGPPNNWRSNFGGSAWVQAPDGQYYLHVFAREQPDLNWENPAMRSALYEMIHWWMDQGVAGFRIDAICFIKKDQSFRDLPPDGPDGLADVAPRCLVQPGIEDFLAEMRDAAFAPRQAFTVAEANGVLPEQLQNFIGENGFFSTIFDFTYTDIDLKSGNWFDASGFTWRDMRDAIFANQASLQGVGHGAPYLENHDQMRSPNKYLKPHQRTDSAIKALGMLYFFLQGIPFVYQGQELGMGNHPWQSIDDFDDVSSRAQYEAALAYGLSEAEALAAIAHRARDNARTPMLWTDAAHAGFSTDTPWLPVHPGFPRINAEAQQQSDASIWAFYRNMLRIRREHSRLFFDGAFLPLCEDAKDVIAYERALDGTRICVYCNFSDAPLRTDLPPHTVLLSTCPQTAEAIAPLSAMMVRMR